MKYVLLIFLSSLFPFNQARKQLHCQANEGSLIHFLVRNKTQAMSCVTSSGEFELSRVQYDNIVQRLMTTETKLESELAARNRTLERLFSGTDQSTIRNQATMQIIGEVVQNLLPSLLASMKREIMLKVYKINGWQQSGNYIFKLFVEHVDYNAAIRRCGIVGGRLAAEILRHRESVRNIISMNNGVRFAGSATPYIGYNDVQTEGSFQWVDGGETNRARISWHSDEPNNVGGDEDCASIYTVSSSSGRLYLNDVNCASSHSYICEVNLDSIGV